MKKYDSIYFGIALGILTSIIFLLLVAKIIMEGKDELLFRITPLIPIMTSMNFLNVLGGLAVSFLWGFFLGFLFIIIYNFYERALNK